MLRWIQVVLRAFLPVVVLVVAASVLERYYPWSVADQLLPERAGQTRLMIKFNRRSVYGPLPNSANTSITYAFLPSAFLTNATHTVAEHPDGTTEVHTNQGDFYLVFWNLITFLALSSVAWYVPLKKKTT
jgi:hypothetical protein